MSFAYLQTGARRDELFRLRWRDVDLSGRRVRLLWRKNVLGEWKESWLPIGDDLVSMLEKQRRVTGLLGFVFMWRSDDEQGKWMPYQYRQHWLKKLCAKAGVKQFGFHGIRHLFASILASKNVPLVEIQKMLRHGSIATTQRYIHSLQEGSREALAALPKLHSYPLKTENPQKNHSAN
jgi:integrase